MTNVNHGAWGHDYMWHGTTPCMGEGDPVVHYAVLSIQNELKLNNFDVGELNGLFGPSTQAATVDFQKHNGLRADGIVGPVTARAMLQLRIRTTANAYSVPPKIIAGLIRMESSYDFGAVGVFDATRRGLAQISSLDHPQVLDADAFNSSFTISWLTDYLRAACKKFKALDVAIAAYMLGYEGAAQWAKDKQGNTEVFTYVANVIEGA